MGYKMEEVDSPNNSVIVCLFNPSMPWPSLSHSPDVRAFLQMDKSQNFSDASEDEDDKVSPW